MISVAYLRCSCVCWNHSWVGWLRRWRSHARLCLSVSLHAASDVAARGRHHRQIPTVQVLYFLMLNERLKMF